MQKELYISDTLRGRVTLPASKSISNRVLIIEALSGGRYEIENLSEAADTRVLVEALRTAGGTAEHPALVDIGPAGTAMRFCTAYFAQSDGVWLLTGSERMKQRPIGLLVDALRALGADIAYAEKEGYPPLLIKGRKMSASEVALPANVSSQYVSALLMLGPVLADGLTLRLTGEIASRPYIDMTMSLMNRFGADASWASDDTIRVAPRPYVTSAHFAVEADWSAASYWYELMALTPDADASIVLPHLPASSLQGDAAVADFFVPLGVRSEWGEEGLQLSKCAATSEPLHIDFSRQPDLAQTLVVTCAMLRRPFRFTGLHSLRIKETDRTTALQAELVKLGVKIEPVGDDEIRYDGNSWPVDVVPSIATYSDHRMAMAFAPCALRHPGLVIKDAEVVSKSYPRFWCDLAPFLA